MSLALSSLAIAVLAAVLYALFQKSAPNFFTAGFHGYGPDFAGPVGSAAQSVLSGLVRLEQRAGGDAYGCLLRCTGIVLLTDYARTLCEEAGAGIAGMVRCAGCGGFWCWRRRGRCWKRSDNGSGVFLDETTWIQKASFCPFSGLDKPLPHYPGGTGSGRNNSIRHPRAEQWQPYLEQSPVSISDFADAPLDALKKLFHGSMAAALQETLRGSTDALLFLLLAALLSFRTSETTNGELLDLIAAGGCGVLLWSSSSRLRNSSVHRWESGAAFCWGFSRSMPES